MTITSEFFSFNVWERFLHSSVFEWTESDLSKINWLRGVILLNPIVLVPWGRFPLCYTPYQTYFGFPGSNLNLDCGLRDHVITRFASPFFASLLQFSFENGHHSWKTKKYFPALPPNTIAKIYRARCARLRLLMNHGILEDICWLIEAKVWLSCDSSNSFISYMPKTGKNTFAKKRRAKRLKICHRYARWTCNATCHFLGMESVNREDKIQFIKDGLSKGSLDNLLLTLEMHPSGDVPINSWFMATIP